MKLGEVVICREQAEAYLEAWEIAEQRFRDDTLGRDPRADHREAWVRERLRAERRGDS